MMYSNQLVCSVKVNGKILKEKFQNNESSVFIPFGAEYSLLFKNLSGRNAIVHAEIDGREINANKSGFYLKSGVTAEIEGFEKNYKTERRFKFIQKTEEISNFRGDRIDDGMIRVTWQFEKAKPEKITVIKEEVYRPHRYHYPQWGCSCPICQPFLPGPYYGGSTWTLMSSIGSKGMSSGGTVGASADVYSCNVQNDSGITVEGSKSNQQFGSAYANELEENIHSMVIILKGYQNDKKTPIEKPIIVHKKLHCSSCGRTWKSHFEFCGNCGTALK